MPPILTMLLLALAIVVICGVLDFLIQKAPMISDEFKGYARYAIIVILAVALIWWLLVLIGYADAGPFTLRRG